MTIAFGISSLFFAILGVFVPFFGIIISGFSGFLAWLSSGKGIPLGAAAVIINLANIFFMSPSYMLTVNMDAHLRSYDQQKMFLIWVIVLYLQISAIGVFIINYFLSLIDFSAIIQSFKKKNRQKHFPERAVQTIATDSSGQKPGGLQLETSADDEPELILFEEQPEASRIEKAEEQEWKIAKNKSDDIWRNLEDIPFEGSKPHDRGVKKNRVLLKAYSIATSCILVAFVIVYLRPDLFPFLTYSNIYNVVSKTFPEKYLSYFQKNDGHQLPPSNSVEVRAFSPLKTSYKKDSVQRPASYKNPESDYWYIIELNSGETILTQDAVITKYYVSVPLKNGQERRISKADLKSYIRRKI